jgi:type II restriction enzyme
VNLFLNTKLAEGYKNNSQRARILTEAWVVNQIYCPSCGDIITNYKNNEPVADFYCEKCIEDFELKSKEGKFGKKITAGAYSKIIQRINSENKPNFFFMGHVQTKHINDFFVVPKHFFIAEIIEKRKPLSEKARRAGWIGSNILFSKIPNAGMIFYVENGIVNSKQSVLKKWHSTVFLRQIKKAETKGWILDIMNCIDGLGKNEFNLNDIYQFEKTLKEIHPENNNIKAKIRQQLQLLRDKNYLIFTGKGTYKLNN